MILRGLSWCYNGRKQNLKVVILLLILFLSFTAVKSDNNSVNQVDFPTSMNNQQGNSAPTSDNLETDQLAEFELLQSSPTINLTNYAELTDATLHFSGLLDYNGDSSDDLVFVAEFPGSTPFDLVIFDGLTYDILEIYENIAEGTYNYSFNTYFIPNPTEILSDLMISFVGEITNVCDWVFVGLTSDKLGSRTEDCHDIQEVVDWDGDGDLDVLRMNSQGNFWTYSINENMALEFAGNLLESAGIEGEFDEFRIANFTGDSIPDYAFTQPSPDQSTTLLYLIDGLTSSIISNTSTGQVLNTILTINIDNSGFDEVIYISATTRQFYALNTTGFDLLYGNFPSGYLFESASVIPDVNNDGVKDILLTKKKSLFLILNGADGDILSISSYIGAIENSIRGYHEVSIGQVSNDSSFVLQTDDQGLKISSYTEDDKILLQTEISWSSNLLSNDILISSTDYVIKTDSLDFDLDFDQDSLTAVDEFFFGTDDSLQDTDGDLLSDIEETQLSLNPISEDSDQDGIDDFYEVEHNMNYFLDDADLDYDDDGLTNIDEYKHGTNINDPDTDGDSLPDGWEIKYGYHANGTRNDRYNDKTSDDDGLSAEEEFKAGTNPHMADTDGDEIPDKWEVDNKLNPLVNQNFTDFDNDGLSALEEYQYNPDLNPRNRDTDGDGLNDGYEVNNGLNALKNDAAKDKDGDFLSNKIEAQIGTNPNGRFDQFISIFVILLTSSGAIFAIISYRRLSTEAKSAGFQNYLHMRSIRKQGFSTLEDYQNAKSSGFHIQEAHTLISSYGFENINSMLLQWQNYLSELDLYLEIMIIDVRIKSIEETITYGHYDESVQNSKDDVEKLRSQIQTTNQLIFELDTIFDLTNRSKIYPFRNLDRHKINEVRGTLNEKINSLNDLNNKYSKLIESKEIWFKPWSSLLTLIQMSSDRSITDLEEIAQVLNIDNEHAKSLIQAVIVDNQLIGTFSEETNQFTKGTNIDGYLKYVLDNIDEEEER